MIRLVRGVAAIVLVIALISGLSEPSYADGGGGGSWRAPCFIEGTMTYCGETEPCNSHWYCSLTGTIYGYCANWERPGTCVWECWLPYPCDPSCPPTYEDCPFTYEELQGGGGAIGK